MEVLTSSDRSVVDHARTLIEAVASRPATATLWRMVPRRISLRFITTAGYWGIATTYSDLDGTLMWATFESEKFIGDRYVNIEYFWAAGLGSWERRNA